MKIKTVNEAKTAALELLRSCSGNYDLDSEDIAELNQIIDSVVAVAEIGNSGDETNYKIRNMERYNVEILVTLSEERYRDYLAAMRDRFNRPSWKFSRLFPRVLREWFALYSEGKLDGPQT